VLSNIQAFDFVFRLPTAQMDLTPERRDR